MWDLLVGYAGIVWFRPAGGSDLEPAPWLPGAVQALSPDGMLVMVNSVPTLTLIDLQTRTRTELPRGGWSAMQCAFSPASDEVAVLWVNGDEAVVTVGPATGDTRREIWRAEGGCNQESAVAWSPTGAQIAVTWQVYDEDEDADFHRTAVIDLNGNELARRENARMFPANPAAWTADGPCISSTRRSISLLSPRSTSGDRSHRPKARCGTLRALARPRENASWPPHRNSSPLNWSSSGPTGPSTGASQPSRYSVTLPGRRRFPGYSPSRPSSAERSRSPFRLLLGNGPARIRG